MSRRGCRNTAEDGTRAVRRRRYHASDPAPIDRQAGLRSLARSLHRETRGLASAFDAERVASTVTSWWGDESLHRRNHFEPSAELGVVAELEEIGDPHALVLLQALGEVAGGDVGPAATQAAARLAGRGVAGPGWVDQIGTAEPTGAWIVRDGDFDDGTMLFAEFRMPDAPVHLVAMWVDHNLGGMSKHLGVCRSMDEIQAFGLADPALHARREDVSLAEMGVRMRAALEATPPHLRMRNGITGVESYALARARAASLPGGDGAHARPRVGVDERFALLEGFLESPEGDDLREDMDAQTLVARAIDFCADDGDGRPLRWSPTVVEIFIADWLPYHCGDDKRMLDRVPVALTAWIRYAGRRRGVPVDRIEETVAVVEEMAGALEDFAGDYGGASSAA